MTAPPLPLGDAWRAAKASGVALHEASTRFVRYRDDPVGFCVEVLGIPRASLVWSENAGYGAHAWDGTPDPLVAMLDGLRDGEDVGVEAGTGTQKSYTAAAVVLWFLACWEGARVFTFAPKEDQLRLYIWTELLKLWPRLAPHFPRATLTDLTLRMRGGIDSSWGAFGYSVAVKAGETVSTNAAGMHAEHLLLIYEETPGIAPAVIAAGENTCTAPHNLRLFLGNPDHQLDTLHLACTSPGVTHVRISGLDHPNVVTGLSIVPGATSRKSNARRLAKYGADGRLYLSRVRGVSPAQAADALILLAWVTRAQARWRNGRATEGYGESGVWALGVDVANSEGGDEAALAEGPGRVLLTLDAFPCPNANDLGVRVVGRMKARAIDGLRVGIDSVGVGAGCVNEVKRHDQWVRALNGGERPQDAADEERYNNLRSQMYWTLREDLRTDQIDLPPDLELTQDLVTPAWEPRNGRIIVESKEDLVKRLGHSPNKGDAAAYWNWVRDRNTDPPPAPTRYPTLLQREARDLAALDQPAAPRGGYTVIRQ